LWEFSKKELGIPDDLEKKPKLSVKNPMLDAHSRNREAVKQLQSYICCAHFARVMGLLTPDMIPFLFSLFLKYSAPSIMEWIDALRGQGLTMKKPLQLVSAVEEGFSKLQSTFPADHCHTALHLYAVVAPSLMHALPLANFETEPLYSNTISLRASQYHTVPRNLFSLPRSHRTRSTQPTGMPSLRAFTVS
jgi:hypothetical protein